MDRLKTVLNSKWFFPVLVLYYGIFYILLGEWYPKVVSTDGNVFLTLVNDFTESLFFNTYYVNRIFPPLIIRVIYKTFAIETTKEAVFIGFQILNLGCIMITTYFLKKIFVLIKVSPKMQFLGFVVFLVNFALLKYPFYLSVMTDTFAIMFSTMLLYFYLKKNTIGLVIITFLLAFTWPMGYYQGLLLIALPLNILPYNPASKLLKTSIYTLMGMAALIAVIIIIFIQKTDVDIPQVARIDRTLLPLSIAGLVIAFSFFGRLFFNTTLFNLPLFFQKLNIKRIALALAVFTTITLTIYLLNPDSTPTYTTKQMLTDPIVHALIKPLLFIIADVTYFGVIIFLLILFWGGFCKVVSQIGWGLVAAFALNLFLFGITPQTRHLSNLFPWIVLFLMKAMDKYSFSNAFYIVVGLIALFVSKIWFVLNNFDAYPPMQLDRNGSMGFPQQKFWMHLGPWMNEQMYFIQGAICLIIMVVLFLMVYKLETNPSGKWQLVNRYSQKSV